MKSRAGYLSVILICLFVFSGEGVFAISHTVDCQGTVTAWKKDKSLAGYMNAHTCSCPYPNKSPV